ncbi:Cationic amino acid transporter 5 [Capsicum baccatum]|uniref:Cationic amino acid transporter 5 n=1 Tax=Capsicum baccatum TaxID=33114 RepID=A0A2G2VZT4_CAPBA|nr:Cationic amino acid transporter 5 [Capsicum baccatum]
MGAGIFVMTGEATKNIAGPAVLLSDVISGTAALFSVLCYSEFSVEIPVAGGSFAYLRVKLGDFVASIAAGNIQTQIQQHEKSMNITIMDKNTNKALKTVLFYI